MEAFLADVNILNKTKPFPEFRSVEFKKETMDIVFTLQHPPPLNTVTVRATKQYLDFYPRGTVSMLVGDKFHVVPTSATNLKDLSHHIHELCMLQIQSQKNNPDDADHEGMGEQAISSQFQVQPTLDFIEDESGYCSGLHPSILQDIAAVKGGKIFLSDQPTINQSIVSIYLDFGPYLSTQTMEAWGLTPKELVEVRVSLNRTEYLNAEVKIQIGQTEHFSMNIFKGAAGQLQRILATFVKDATSASAAKSGKSKADALNRLIDFGFDQKHAELALKKAGGDVDEACGMLISETQDDLMTEPETTSHDKAKEHGSNILTKKMIPPATNGFFQQVIDYVFQRLQSLPEFCVICDRPHVFANGLMLQASVCSRELCVFRHQALDVAKEISSSIAVQTGVIDMMIVFAQLAVKSTRFELIFNPYPVIMDDKGTPVITPEKKDIEKCRGILAKIPKMKDIAASDSAADVQKLMEKADPLAYKMFSWIISSNKSYVVQIPEKDVVEAFGTKHQYLLVQEPPERQAKFNERKAKHGATWAFHGSRAENWYSILRNGIINASGTKYQLNGTAHGNGIYISPNASVSYGYSQISTSTSKGKDIPELEKQFIDPNTMHCIAVCEVVNFEIKKSGNIWVTQHEDCIMTRFLFVYQHGFSAGGNVDLTQTKHQDALNQLAAQYCN